jgi:hypothetical protein
VAGAAFLLLSLYYARFFVLRQEPSTMLQMMALWCASAWLLLGSGAATDGREAWFRGWWPVRWSAWALLLGALVAAVMVFVVLDRDSHSASDTLTRIAPTFALLAALVLRVHAERSVSRP